MAVFYWWTLVEKEVSLMSLNNDTTGGQSVTEYEYKILFGFQKSPNTECSILFGIDKIRIPNTEYYLVSRKSEYLTQIVLFGLTIQIPNTK